MDDKIKLQCANGVIFETLEDVAYKSELIALTLNHQSDPEEGEPYILGDDMEPDAVRRILQFYALKLGREDPVQIAGEKPTEELWPKRLYDREIHGADIVHVDNPSESSIKLETVDRFIFKIDANVAKYSAVITNILELCGHALRDRSVIPLPKIFSAELRLVLEWIGHHRTYKKPVSFKGKSQTYVPDWDRDFMYLDDEIIFALAKAVNFLDVRGMDEIVNRTIANMMIGQDVDYIRDLFTIAEAHPDLTTIDLRKTKALNNSIMESMKRNWEANEAEASYKI